MGAGGTDGIPVCRDNLGVVPRFLIVLVALLVASCAGDGNEGNPGTTSVPVTTVTTSAHPVTTSSGQPSFEEVIVELSADGAHVVDENGMSLYLFTLDDSRTSSCTDACAETWPPFLGSPVAGDGVDPELLGNAERGNGSIQVTYSGQPLYTYIGDTSPGDVTGNGFNEVWFLVGADGNAVQSP